MSKKEININQLRAVIKEEVVKLKKTAALEVEKNTLNEELKNLGSSNEKIMAQMFVEFLPEDFPSKMHILANKKNLSLDSAYHLLIGAYETMFENEKNTSFKWDDFDFMDELDNEMFNRFGDKIEF